MEILSWNLEFWRRICEKWWDNKTKTWKYNDKKEMEKWLLNATITLQCCGVDSDITLLQEINPCHVLGIDYNPSISNIHKFEVGIHNIYYHEILSILKKERPNDPFWGNTITTDNKTILLKNHNYIDNKYIGKKFFGYEALMCYDFKLNDGNIITLINFYKKGLDGNYDYEDEFFHEISKVVETVNNKNLIFFAGDFNAKPETLERITKIGFVEKTAAFKNTMVEVENVKPYHNDCVFVNEKYADLVKVEKIPYVTPKEIYRKYSDHYGFRSIINFK